jgi:Putative Actinobacterial Holin-X, holin superfamily III
MPEFEGQRSLTDLLGGLASDISGLFRKEVQLAKAEASEKVDELLTASRGLAVGGLLAIGAIGVLLAAVVIGVAWLLVSMGMDQTMASLLASLIVAVVVGAIAWSTVSRSLAAVKASRLNMDRTTHSLARDAQVVKESI